MALKDKVTQAVRSRLQKAIGALSAGADRVSTAVKQNPSQFFFASLTALGSQRQTFQSMAQTGQFPGTSGYNSPLLRTIGSFGADLAGSQERGSKNIAQGATKVTQGKPLQGIAQAGFGGAQYLQAPASITPPNLARAGASGMIAGGINAGIAKFQGQDTAQAFGSGFGQGARLSTITRLTDPVIGKVAGSLAPATGLLGRQLVTRGVTGLGNVAEDRLIDTVDQRARTTMDDLSSFAIGGALGGNDEIFDLIRKTKAGELSEKALESAINKLGESKRKLTIPVSDWIYNPKKGVEERVTMPMWKWMLKDQTGAVGGDTPGYLKASEGNQSKGIRTTQSQALEQKATQTVGDSSPSSSALPKPSQLLSQMKKQELDIKQKSLTSERIISQARSEIGSVSQEPQKPLGQVASDFYTQWVDRFHPIVKASDTVAKIGKQKGFVLRPEYDPKYLVRRLTGAGGIADYKFNTELKPVIQQMEAFGIDKTDMDVYLKSRRDIGLSKRGIKGSDANKAEERMNVLKEKYGDDLDVISTQLYDYQNKGFQELIDAGFLSPESASLIRQQNPDYVPFERVMDELDNYLGVPSVKAQQGTSPVAKIKGSERQILSPIESIISNTFKQRAAIEKNRVASSIVGLQQIAPELGFTQAQKSSANTITVWKNGKKEYWNVGSDIAEATKGLNEESMNLLLKIFSAPAALLRQGATGRNPEFMIPNVIRDQLDAGITSKYGYIPFVDFVRGLSSMVKNDDIYKKWEQSGAKIDLGDIRGRQSVSELFDEKTARKGLFSWLGKGLDVMGKYSEVPTRVGLFKKAYEKTGNELIAAMESRDATVDFSRMGSKMKVANSVIPFLNVSVQGFDKLVRSVKQNPGKIALLMGAYGAVPQASSTLYNLLYHPEEYAEIPQYEKDSNFVFINGRNEDGTVDYFTIPKGHAIQLVTNPIQSFLEYSRGNNTQTFAEFATQFLSSSAPVIGDGSSLGEVGLKTVGGLTPQLFKPMAESLLNKSFYKYDPNKEQAKSIVPEYLNKKPAGDRSYEWTPKMYKAIGKVANVSPLKVQSLMEGYLAGYAKIPAQIVDILANVSDGKSVDANQRTILRRFYKQTYPSSGSSSTGKNVERAKILAQASASEKIPTVNTSTRDVDLAIYKDAVTKINKYKENKTKAQAGLVEKSVEEYQQEFDEANLIKREMEKKYSAQDLLSDHYLRELPDKPPTSRYEKSIYEGKVWDRLSDVESSSLNEYEKQKVRQVLLKKIGVSEDQYDYYSVAKNNNNEKTLYTLDQIETMETKQELVQFLIQGRKPVRGKIIMADGVIDNLVNDGIIPSQLGKELKALDINEDGSLKRKKSGGSSKAKTAQIKAVKAFYSDISKIRFTAPNITPPKLSNDIKAITFGK